MSIMQKIQAALPDMPAIYRKIAIYVMENRQSVGFSSIHSLSAACGVSNATVLRFARSLGFSGYADFKHVIQEEIKRKLSPYEKVALSDLDTRTREEQFRKLRQNEIDNLRKTLDEIRVGDLAIMVEGIAAAERVFVSGFGVSSHIVQILEYALSSSQDKTIIRLTGSVSDYAPKLRSLRRGDALFLMTFPSYSREAIHVAEYAKSVGGRVFLFTDSARCPIYSLADAVARCENNSLLMTNSYVGLVAVSQILVNMLFLANKDGAVSRVDDVLAIERKGYERLGEDPEDS